MYNIQTDSNSKICLILTHTAALLWHQPLIVQSNQICGVRAVTSELHYK